MAVVVFSEDCAGVGRAAVVILSVKDGNRGGQRC